MDDSNPEQFNESTVTEVSADYVSADNDVVSSHEDEKMVPLSVVQKERKKRQQIQQEYEALLQQSKRHEGNEEEDLSRYESVTREELDINNKQVQRSIREDAWSERNPEKAIFVEQELENFLRSRPNLAPAISNATNRVQEAWELMNALSGKEKQNLKAKPRQDAPLSPSTVPKGAALNETTDVMNMSDSEFREWRKGKRKAR